MKRITTTFALLLLLTGYAGAQQQLTNAGFESWDTIGDYTQPSNWYSLNPLTIFGFDQSTNITGDAHTGSFAVQLESVAGTGQDLSGVLCTGPILDAAYKPDFSKMKVPFTSRPQALEVYFKSFPKDGDACVMGAYLTRWNVAMQKTDTVGEAGITWDDSVGVFTLASCAFIYHSPLQPDSMFLIASSSSDGFNPVIGSKLILDDIHLTYSSGLNDVNALPLSMYPNPANSTFVIQTEEVGTLKLYSVTGVLVHEQRVDSKQTVVDVATFSEGMYFMTVQSERGMMASRKIKVQH
ncbi:MAG: T9SS type A sorting domain-containing protein [Bacteroidota bacterium]